MSRNFTYTFAGGLGSINIVTSNNQQEVTTGTGFYSGFAITSVSGTFNGQQVIGLFGDGGTLQRSGYNDIYDNTIFINSTQGYGGKSYNGIDQNGIDFSLADGNHVNLYQTTGGISSLNYQIYTPSGATVGSVGATTITATNYNTAVCYCTGTLIRTACGEVAVEALAIGDRVVTASGEERPIKWIGHRAYAARFANANPEALLPVCFKAGSLADGVPVRDLWVSPKHAMFLDGVLIPAQHLVNGVTIVKVERVDSLGYWHVELASHDVLIAEGAESESFVDDEGRSIFHNAHEFAALYPDEYPVVAMYCAPRVEDGYELEAVRRRLVERAGLPVPAAPGFAAELRGYIEGFDGATVWGWAQDAAHPDAPVCLDVLVDDVLAGHTYAESYRADLAAAGIGEGCHAFSLSLPPSLTGGASRAILVRRSADGAALTDLRTIEPLRAAA